MPTEVQPIQMMASIVYVFLGILISLILPVAVNTLRRATGSLEARKTWTQRLVDAWNKYGGNRYLIILAMAVVVAIVIVLLLDLKFYTVRDALLAGFSWEALVNKLFGRQKQ